MRSALKRSLRPAGSRPRALSPVAAVLLLLGPAVARGGDPATPVELDRLRDHVKVLASDEFEGRGSGEGARKAREYVADAFKGIGL